jgi:multidrug resistance efflux pump
MNRSRSRALGVAFSIGLGLVVAVTARGDDRVTAEALLLPIERDAAHASVTSDAVKQARASLERARRMRDANDEPRARLAEALGRRWAEVARDLVRAADVERAATTARLAADDAGARADRERALLEEAIATQGRLQAELDAIQSKPRLDRTALAGMSVDGGAAAPKASANRPTAAPPRAPGGDSLEAGVMP